MCGLRAWLKALCALKFARFNNIKIVAIVTLIDYHGAGLEIKLLHGTKDDLELGWVKCTEHEGLAETVPQCCRQLL